jgi:hypothetical protein
MQEGAQGPDVRRGPAGGFHEGGHLLGAQLEAFALSVEELHPVPNPVFDQHIRVNAWLGTLPVGGGRQLRPHGFLLQKWRFRHIWGVAALWQVSKAALWWTRIPEGIRCSPLPR